MWPSVNVWRTEWQEKTRILRDLKTQVQALLDEKESMAGESQELTKQKAKLELNIKDLKDEEAGHKSSKVCVQTDRPELIDWLYLQLFVT